MAGETLKGRRQEKIGFKGPGGVGGCGGWRDKNGIAGNFVAAKFVIGCCDAYCERYGGVHPHDLSDSCTHTHTQL